MAQRRALFDRGRSAQRVSCHRRQRADARDRRPERSPKPARCYGRALVLGMVVGRLWTHSGHPHHGDAQGDLRSRSRLAAVGPLARRLDYSVCNAAMISPIASASWKRRMAAIPAAPDSRHTRVFSSVIPPMAITGMDTARQTCANFAGPWAGPKLAFEGVSKTGPKK